MNRLMTSLLGGLALALLIVSVMAGMKYLMFPILDFLADTFGRDMAPVIWAVGVGFLVGSIVVWFSLKSKQE